MRINSPITFPSSSSSSALASPTSVAKSPSKSATATSTSTLLFYHTQLHCYVVIELKTGDFEPEFAGKLNFYLKAVDETLRSERDEPTIGILICKSKDKLIADYALSDISKPIGVSEYQLTKSLPENLKPRLPSIEELENELQPEFDDER